VLRKLSVLAMLLVGSAAAFSQAVPAAIRNGNIEAGAFVTGERPDYGIHEIYGFGVVADVNARQWYGLEIESNFNFINGPAGTKETTYTAGPRFIYVRNRWIPYAKLEFGIGGLTFPNKGNPHHDYANLTFGGGADWRWKRNLTVRVVDIEYQDWFNFGHASDLMTRAGALTPFQVSVGLKYRFFQ
jgi:opacity protein-like surface antigen